MYVNTVSNRNDRQTLELCVRKDKALTNETACGLIKQGVNHASDHSTSTLSGLVSSDFHQTRPFYKAWSPTCVSAVLLVCLVQVMPILISVLLHSKEEERKDLVENLAKLVGLLRQHLRKWLVDLLQLIDLFWTSDPPLQMWLLKLIKELAGSSFFLCQPIKSCPLGLLTAQSLVTIDHRISSTFLFVNPHLKIEAHLVSLWVDD